jgi:hypothetical protein
VSLSSSRSIRGRTGERCGHDHGNGPSGAGGTRRYLGGKQTPVIIEIRREWHPWDNVGGDTRIGMVRDERWIRFAIYAGSAPGSHMGFWRTNTDRLRGYNYRIGTISRCVTVFVHWRRP